MGTPAQDDMARWIEGGWLVNPAVLDRGRLTQVTVELEPDPVFRLTNLVTAMTDLVGAEASLFGLDDAAQVASTGRVMRRLLSGLVPVRGRCLAWETVTIDGREWIVDKRLLPLLPAQVVASSRTLVLVGVAEEALFWKDIRRVLFSRATFDVMARVARPGLQSEWTPVKLAESFQEVAPEIGTLFTDTAMLTARRPAPGATPGREMTFLFQYAQQLLEMQTVPQVLRPEDIADVLDCAQGAPWVGLDARRRASSELTRRLADRHGLERDPEAEAELRHKIWTRPATNSAEPDVLAAAPIVPDDRLLDTEIIAIFW